MVYDLREAKFLRDDEDTDQEYNETVIEAARRLTKVGELMGTDSSTLVQRLREPLTEALGQPCKPFYPEIQKDAARLIIALNALEGVSSKEESVGDDKEVDWSAQSICNLVSRLLGFYAIGPGGNPEFGWRLFPTSDLKVEAAAKICWEFPYIGTLTGVGPSDTEPTSVPGVEI